MDFVVLARLSAPNEGLLHGTVWKCVWCGSCAILSRFACVSTRRADGQDVSSLLCQAIVFSFPCTEVVPALKMHKMRSDCITNVAFCPSRCRCVAGPAAAQLVVVRSSPLRRRNEDPVRMIHCCIMSSYTNHGRVHYLLQYTFPRPTPEA